jgi:hypothetical protein
MADDDDDDELYVVKHRLELARSAIVSMQSRIARLESGQRQLRSAAGRAPTGIQQRRRVANAVRIKETAG